MTLANQLDEISYNVLSQESPELLAAVQTSLKAGATPQMIERDLRQKHGNQSSVVNVAIQAAYYLHQNKPKEKK